MAWINSIVLNTFMTTLMIEIAQTSGQAGVALSLRGAAIANDGYVNVNDIGNEDYNALLCHTDKTDCCYVNRAGDWYYPNGTSLGPMGYNIARGHTSYFFRSRGTQTVHLKRERHPSERGKFCCEVPNAYNSIRSICINVVNIGPVVIYPFGSSITSMAGKNFTLECSAVVTPNPLPANVSYPSFEWFYGPNNSSLPLGISVSNVSRSGDSYISNIHFSPLRQSHAGMYTCQLGGNARLAAHTMLKVNAMIVIIQPMDLIVNSNDTAVFNFTVLGESAMEFTYQWQKNGSNLVETPSKFEGVHTTKLVIKQARNEDEGAYWCVITDRAGDNMVATNEVFLIVVDLPVKPMITNVSAASTSITITWEQDLSSDIFWYELQYNFTIRTCDYTGKGNKVINSSLRSFTFENSSKTPVEEDSVYSILFIAVNLDGRSEASVSEVSTHGNVPTGAPENLTEMFVDDRTIVILWEPVECGHRNGEITGYSVTYYPAAEIMKSTTNISHTTFTARGLIFDTEYVFEVHAISIYGMGPSATTTLRTLALQGMMIVYDGQSYQSNSIANLDEEGGMLQCFTNRSDCCKSRRLGQWIYPNGSSVVIIGKNGDFYRTRNVGVVTLLWTENALIPKGVFCCDIPPSQTACIGIYPEGEGIAMVVNITVNPKMHGLVCTSTGGPATSVVWKIDGEMLITDGTTYRQSQRIVSKENAIFENILHIPTDNVTNYNATYECLVMNSAGNDSMSLRVEAIQIAHESVSIGGNGRLVCKSIITVDVMELLNSDGEVIASKTNTNELGLTLVNSTSQVYTCRVNKNASVNKTVIVLVTEIHGPSIIFIGEAVTINCITSIILGIKQLPTLTLTLPNGTNLSSTEGKLISFMPDPVHIKDAGEYTCMAAGLDQNIMEINVQAKRNFIFKLPTPKIGVMHNDSLSVGSKTVLNCTVKNYSIADTSIKFMWLTSGIFLSNNTDRVVIFNHNESLSTFTSQLTLSPLSDNDSNITCSVNVYPAIPNSFIEMSPTVSKQVQLNIEAPSVYATISDSGATPVIEQPYSLFCSVTGDEKLDSSITYQWTKYSDTGIQPVANSGNLTFSSLSLSNSGNYSCSVVISSSYLSEVITAISNLFRIRLQVPSPSSVVIIPPPYLIFTGHKFHISCIVNTSLTVDIPVTVNVVWNQPVQNYTSPASMTENPNEYISTAVFVSDVQSKRMNFQCTANLSSNSSFVTASENKGANKSVYIIGRPSQPTGIIVSVGSTFINISWINNGDNELNTVHGYELQYKYTIRECQNSTVTGMTLISNSSDINMYYTLEGLEEDSEFNISIITFNPAGKSEPATLIATTSPSAPTGVPQDLSITSVDITNVTIRWNSVECSQRNGRIDGYRLLYYSTVDNRDIESILINGSNANTFTIVGLQPSSDYTLALQAIGGNYSLFGSESRRTVQTLIPQAVGFLLHGKVYSNNSIVSLMEIDEKRKALLCITNKSGCCTRYDRPPTEWHFPNGSLVRINGSGDSFYRNRDVSIVLLNRRNNAMSPTGIFWCDIPGSNGISNFIYIGIYLDGQVLFGSVGTPNISSLTFSRSSISLICISTGGPVTTVTWRKNNQLLSIDGIDYQQTQIIVDSVNAEYRTILYSNDVSNLVGVFTCIVQNARGSDNKTISTNDKSLSIRVTSDNSIAGKKYCLTCIVTINGSYDVPSISWNTSMSDEIISNGNGTYLSVLHFNPLLFSDQGTYTCLVKIADITDMQTYHFTVKAPTVLVNIEDTGVAQTAGKSYTLICNVSHHKNLNPTFEYQWFKDNGTLTRVGTNSSTLSFHFLKLSDTGWYTCNVIIDYTHLSGPVSHLSSRAFELQFSVPQPITVEVISDKPNPILSGTLLTLTCAVELSPAVDVPVAVSTKWTRSDGSTLMYTNPPIRLSFTHYISTAVLKDIELADSGDYNCTVDIGDEITISAKYSVIVGNGMFQLRLKRTEDCQLWTVTKATTYRNNVEDTLEEAIRRLCRCNFSKDNFLKGSFGCDTSPNLTTYRNTLIGTHNFNATQLIGFIQDWVNTGPKIKMDWYTVGVDSSCPVAIATLEEKECD